MSTTPRSTVPSSREQLDELDALLQRMLDVSVGPEGEPAAAPPAVDPKAELPPVTSVSSPGGLKRPAPPRVRPDEKPRPASYKTDVAPPAKVTPPVRKTPKAPAPQPASAPVVTPEPAADGPTIKIVPPGTAPASTSDGADIPFAEVTSPRVTVRTGSSDDMPLAWWQRMLGLVNLPFDCVASRLGAPGRWARQPTGRRTLGWIGVALLAVSIILLVLDWIGWPP